MITAGYSAGRDSRRVELVMREPIHKGTDAVKMVSAGNTVYMAGDPSILYKRDMRHPGMRTIARR